MAFFIFTSLVIQARDQIDDTYLKSIDLNKIKAEKNEIKYDLNDIIKVIEDSIEIAKRVVVPENATEFEKALITARRIQHNDSQLVATKLFKYLLEFECYRTPGEKLYLEYLLAQSLNYLGAPIIANHYFNHVFPELLNYLENSRIKSYFLSHYGGILAKNDSLEKAKEIYFLTLKLNLSEGDDYWICSARNNYAFILKNLGKLDSAKYYHRQNQHPKFKTINPVLHAFAFGNYGAVLHKEGQLDSAIFYYKKEIKMLNEIPTAEGLINTYLSLGDCFEDYQMLDSAYYYYNQSLSLSKEKFQLSNILNVYNRIINLIGKTNLDIDLPKFLEEYQSINSKYIESIAAKSVESEYQVTRFIDIIKEASLSKKEYEELSKENTELTFTIILLGVLLLGLAFVLISKRNSRKKLAEINESLKIKNQELSESYLTISDGKHRSEILLKELHHRVKNNLQVISSLFNLQINAQNMDEKSKEVFREAQDRIHSISLVHKHIYKSDQFSHLEFADYLKVFARESATMNLVEFDLEIDLDPFPLPIDVAIPLGLIFNELFVNSIKHGKSDHKLLIRIYEEKQGKESRLIYIDNGPGIKHSNLNLGSDNSIGVTLIELLTEQINLEYEFKEASAGKYGFYFHIDGLSRDYTVQ